jgi:hypothetical protein
VEWQFAPTAAADSNILPQTCTESKWSLHATNLECHFHFAQTLQVPPPPLRPTHLSIDFLLPHDTCILAKHSVSSSLRVVAFSLAGALSALVEHGREHFGRFETIVAVEIQALSQMDSHFFQISLPVV